MNNIMLFIYTLSVTIYLILIFTSPINAGVFIFAMISLFCACLLSGGFVIVAGILLFYHLS